VKTIKRSRLKAINQIANMAMVEWSDNIKISDQAPDDYWPAQIAAKMAKGGFDEERLTRQMTWHALPSGWQTMDYQEFLAARRRLMATVVKDAFSLLASHGYQPTYPEPATAPETSLPPLAVYGVSLKHLLDAGLLVAGTPLLPGQDDLDAVGELLKDGRIKLGDEIYDSPSGAANAARGLSTNGWNFWIADTAGGARRLADLRDELLNDD
jgi:hypothetical protein